MYNIKQEEVKQLIMKAVMMGVVVGGDIDIDNPPKECPMSVVLMCEQIFNEFLNDQLKKQSIPSDQELDDKIKDLLNSSFNNN